MKTNNDRILHYRIQPHLQADRVGFEVVLPCDVDVVTGIALSARPGRLSLTNAGNQTELAGLMTLCWNAPGHVFYQGPVHTGQRFEDDYARMGLSKPDAFPTGTTGFAIDSGKIEPVDLRVPGHLRTLQGYYIDVINRMGSVDEDYPLDLFFYYRRTSA